jgi:hypothetical protein
MVASAAAIGLLVRHHSKVGCCGSLTNKDEVLHKHGTAASYSMAQEYDQILGNHSSAWSNQLEAVVTNQLLLLWRPLPLPMPVVVALVVAVVVVAVVVVVVAVAVVPLLTLPTAMHSINTLLLEALETSHSNSPLPTYPHPPSPPPPVPCQWPSSTAQHGDQSYLKRPDQLLLLLPMVA